MKFPKKPAKRAGSPKPRAAKKSSNPKGEATTKANKARAKTKTVTLTQQELIPQVRHTKLDALCESIGRVNEKRLKLQQDEDADKQAALDYMLKHDVSQYHHYGTELVVRDGKKTLSVRKHKEVTATTTISTMPGDEALGGE